MKNLAIVALLAAVMSVGAIIAACGDSPPAASPSNSTSAPADSSSAAPAGSGSAAPK